MIERGRGTGVAGWIVVLMLVACGDDGVGGVSVSGSSSGTSTGSADSTGVTSGVPTTGADTSGGMTTTTVDPPTTTTSTSETSTGADTTTGDSTTTPETTESSSGAPVLCGNAAIDDGEACDGDELGGATCESEGFSGGELGCLGDCSFDTQGCTLCGNGVLEPGEGCDDGDTAPGDGCDAACEVEACDPDGVYAVQGPAIAYTCCLGLVTVNINAFTLANDGAQINSSPSNPAAMAGAATTCPDGDFAAQAMIAGGCTETYAVSGSFTDANTWTGEYTLTFTGEQCSCFNGMVGTPCINQVFPVTAKR